VTWNYQSAHWNAKRETHFGPGPYVVLRKSQNDNPRPMWELARMSDGYELEGYDFFETNLKVLTFLTAAREAIHEAEI
jgi:hypothetical protein